MTAMPPPPPTDFDPSAIAFPDLPMWPKVVGIIAIVLASLGLTCSGCGVFSPQLDAWGAKFQEKEMGSPKPQELKPGIESVVISLVSLPFVAVHMLAGIMLLMRRAVARPLFLLYGVSAILLFIVGVYLQFRTMHIQAAYIAQNPGEKWAQAAQIGQKFAYVVLAIVTVVSLPWPIFCLVWFGVVKRKPEDMTGGAEQPAA